jgi:hypothetical protein
MRTKRLSMRCLGLDDTRLKKRSFEKITVVMTGQG